MFCGKRENYQNSKYEPSISIDFLILLLWLLLIITVSDEEIDFGEIEDLNELFVDFDEPSNEGDNTFKLPFMDWLLFHLVFFGSI